MKIKKAIITSAGLGSRFLPITKTIQKEMLPVLNRPVIDFLVEDCVNAGITEIVFVINEHNYQVLHFYRENARLGEQLAEMGKSDRYERIQHLHTQAKFTFVKQQDSDPYGTAVPVLLAKDHIKDEEAFIVLMGDDFLYNPHGNSSVTDMIDTFTQSNAKSLVTCLTKPQEELYRYGVAKIFEENGFSYLTGLVEKPPTGTEPSNFINISKYILTPEIIEIIEQQQLDPSSGELYITDSVTTFAQNNPVVIHQPSGAYLDCGSPNNWLKANLMVAKNHPDISPELKEAISKLPL